jgi:DNA-binding HxlR family transcriptional regulator
MTTSTSRTTINNCPSEYLLKQLAGKWKTCIFRYASYGPVRFSQLLKILPGSSKQSITVALRELEEAGILSRSVLRHKPLHVEYELTDTGLAFIPVFKMLESLQLVPPPLTKIGSSKSTVGI